MPDKQEESVQRNIALSMASYNIGAVAEKAYVNGVTAYAGKAYMLADGFQKERSMVIGFQECRSKEGGTLQIGNYHSVIPDPKGQVAGDVELWFNTAIPWVQDDPATTMQPKDAQIVATGPEFMIVHLGNKWINIDIIVAHAPHSWDSKHQEGAEEQTYAFGNSLEWPLQKGPTPTPRYFFWETPTWSCHSPKPAMTA